MNLDHETRLCYLLILYLPGLSIWDVYSQSPYNTIPYNQQTYDDYNDVTIVDDKKSLKTGRVAADSYYKAEYDAQVKILHLLRV